DEHRGPLRLRGRARVADARGDLQRAELHRLVDIDVELRDPPGDLVEPRERRDGVGDGLGESGCGQGSEDTGGSKSDADCPTPHPAFGNLLPQGEKAKEPRLQSYSEGRSRDSLSPCGRG